MKDGMTFQELVKDHLNHLPETKMVVIKVHDDLFVARVIAQSVFGETSPEVVLQIRKCLVEEEKNALK